MKKSTPKFEDVMVQLVMLFCKFFKRAKGIPRIREVNVKSCEIINVVGDNNKW